jgi:hypothetical protein
MKSENPPELALGRVFLLAMFVCEGPEPLEHGLTSSRLQAPAIEPICAEQKIGPRFKNAAR